MKRAFRLACHKRGKGGGISIKAFARILWPGRATHAGPIKSGSLSLVEDLTMRGSLRLRHNWSGYCCLPDKPMTGRNQSACICWIGWPRGEGPEVLHGLENCC